MHLQQLFVRHARSLTLACGRVPRERAASTRCAAAAHVATALESATMGCTASTPDAASLARKIPILVGRIGGTRSSIGLYGALRQTK